MTNIQKYRLIETMSKAFTPKEIAERTGLKLNTIYHFRSKYNLPTDKMVNEEIIEEAQELIVKRKLEHTIQALKEAKNYLHG